MATDPRAASITVQDGPADLIGQELVIVTPVTIDGVALHMPKPLPGMLEYVAVTHAEARADELRATFLHDLDERGPVPYKSDATPYFEFLSAGIASLFQRLCNREYAGAARMMLEAFEAVSPGWVGKQRALDLPPPPDA